MFELKACWIKEFTAQYFCFGSRKYSFIDVEVNLVMRKDAIKMLPIR